MNSGPADHAKHPADPSGPLPSVWLRILRLAISLVILWCLWLIYPMASVRICAARVAGYYEPDVDPGTGHVKNYIQRRAANSDKTRAWEENLADQPIPRLLSLLPSRDPVGIWVVSRAIERQLRIGTLVGWPGKREPVPPLDAEAAELILQVLEQDLPPPAAESLVKLLMLIPRDGPQYSEILRKATEHRQPLARAVGTRVLDFMDLDTDEAFELVEKLAKDPDPHVRSALISYLGSIVRKPGTTTLRTKYQKILLGAMVDDSPRVRSDAIVALEVLDLQSEEVAEVLVTSWNLASGNGRWSLFTQLVGGSMSGPPPQLPPKVIDAMIENPAVEPAGRSHEFLYKLLALPGIPAERQWQLIEAQLQGPDEQSSLADLRSVLFLPTEPQHYRSGIVRDWKQIRERFRPFALEAKPRLLEWATEAIKSEDDDTVRSGLDLLAAIAPEDPDRLTPVLFHASAKVRVWTLYWLVPSEQQLPRVLELLTDSDPSVRSYAASALNRYTGPFSALQLEQLVSALREQTDFFDTRESIFKVLQARSPENVDFQQILIDILSSDFPHAREWAVRTLQSRSADAEIAWPHLMKGIRSGRLGATAVSVVVQTGRPIESPDDAIRMIGMIIQSRGSSLLGVPQGMGAALGGVQTDLQPQLVSDLLKLCAPDETGAILIEGLSSSLDASDESSRHLAIHLIGEADIDPGRVLNKFKELLESDRWETRQGAALALGAMGPKAKAMAPLLIASLADPQSRVRMAAADGLGAIGPDAGSEAAAALAKTAQHDKIAGAQLAAIEALGKMEQHIQAHRDTLEELSKRGDPMVRKAAAKVLSRQNAAEQ